MSQDGETNSRQSDRAGLRVPVDHSSRRIPMQLTEHDLLLVTGATGLVGSHVAEQARQKGLNVRALVRRGTKTDLLKSWGVQIVEGDLDSGSDLSDVMKGVTVVVHCAAKVGDWGPTEDYRRVNVQGTQRLIEAALKSGTLRRWVHISSLGVYEGRDHHGTDETTQPSTSGIDGYTLTKVESEQLVCDFVRRSQLPAVILRPGFIYGPRDRTVLPRLMEKLKAGKFKYLGNTDKLMNNTYVGNLCEAIWLAVERDDVLGEVFNIHDPRSVSKKEFVETICETAGIPKPTGVVPLPIARGLAAVLETVWKLTGRKEAPLVNSARIKFLGLNLDFSIQKAIHKLGYAPSKDFADAMRHTVRQTISHS